MKDTTVFEKITLYTAVSNWDSSLDYILDELKSSEVIVFNYENPIKYNLVEE